MGRGVGPGRRWGVLLAVVLGLVVTACARSAAGPWAVEAQAWVAGYQSAARERTADQAPYLARSSVLVHEGLGSAAGSGRDEVVAAWQRLFGASLEEMHPGGLYLDATGAVYPETLDLSAWRLKTRSYPHLVHLEVGEQGIVARRDARPTFQAPGDPAVQALARRYVAAWSSARPGALARVYAPGAVLADSLHGVEARGVEAIAALATAGTEQPEHRLEQVGGNHPMLDATVDRASPAVYSFSPPSAPSQQGLWLLQRSADPCPGATAVRLLLDRAGQVVSERRFHAVVSVRACGAPPEPGWWHGRDEPEPLSERVTGSLATPAGPVEIRNGGPATDRLIRWGLGRLEQAGLAAPALTAVAFDPYDPACDHVLGRSVFSGESTRILLCLDDQRLCADGDCRPAPSEERLVLHEISHAWLRTHLDERTRARFTSHVGARSWNDPDDEWADRGVEWAAETLAWGLLGSPADLLLFGSPPCATLHAGFTLLTDTGPVTDCPP